MDVKIERALLSVSDKAGILDFARNLHDMDVETAFHRRHRQSTSRSWYSG